MVGHFAVFNEWTEIDSMWEGHFMERISPGAFSKTMVEQRDRVKVTFNHGHDPDLGDKVLGPIESLSEDATGAAYEVPLFPSVPPLIVDGLRAGQYGSSFRFRVMKEELDNEPGVSEQNPEALPERTITELQLFEFGPVTYPAYANATAGVRSMTDEWFFDQATRGDGLAKLAAYVRGTDPPKPAESTSEPERETPEPSPAPTEPKGVDVSIDIDKWSSLDQLAARLDEVKSRQTDITTEFGTRAFTAEVETEWNELKEEKALITARIGEVKDRQAEIADNAKDERKVVREPEHRTDRPGSRIPDNVFDRAAYRQSSYSEEDEKELIKGGAQRAVEQAVFPDEVNHEETQATVARMVKRDESGEMAERVLLTGSPVYQRAFGKMLRGSMISGDEQKALERAAFTLGSTGMPLVFTLDPTVIRTSNYVINPLRAISRVETISGTNEWRGVTSGAVTATYEAEATEAVDQTPTLTQPAVTVQRAQTFVPYSREVDQDWGAVQSEMSGLFQEAKDILEATQFYSGAGTTVFPQGIRTGLTNTQRVQTATTAVFVVADLYSLQNALPPRARNAGSTFISSLTQLNRVRALDTSGGSSLWVQLGAGLPDRLLGMPAYELSTMPTAITTTTDLMIVGDFAKGYLIVDRIGMEIELIPHLFGATSRFPTGQRGLWAMWRNSAKVLDANRFRFLQVL